MRSVRQGARICHDALRLGSDGCNTAIGPIGEGSRDRCHVSDKDFVVTLYLTRPRKETDMAWTLNRRDLEMKGKTFQDATGY